METPISDPADYNKKRGAVLVLKENKYIRS